MRENEAAEEEAKRGTGGGERGVRENEAAEEEAKRGTGGGGGE